MVINNRIESNKVLAKNKRKVKEAQRGKIEETFPAKLILNIIYNSITVSQIFFLS